MSLTHGWDKCRGQIFPQGIKRAKIFILNHVCLDAEECWDAEVGWKTRAVAHWQRLANRCLLTWNHTPMISMAKFNQFNVLYHTAYSETVVAWGNCSVHHTLTSDYLHYLKLKWHHNDTIHNRWCLKTVYMTKNIALAHLLTTKWLNRSCSTLNLSTMWMGVTMLVANVGALRLYEVKVSWLAFHVIRLILGC